ncbi:hypothetical protein H6F61_24130 [Cyanobacteria bacterium FACHB-472]|nr:hypothetical protein [Cyanobacteria bacterium FACHB-472]
MSKSERVSIRPYHLGYLSSFGEVLGTNDYSEIVNHILNCHQLGCGNVPTNPHQNSLQVPSKIQP